MRRAVRTSAVLLLLALGPGGIRPADAGDGPRFHTLARAGFGTAGEDGFVLLLAEQGLAWSGFELTLAGPFRLRVVDRDPQDDGVLREQDWDEPSDFARIVPRIGFLRSWPDGAVRVDLGELKGVGLGHGTVFDHYYNGTDMDRYQGGLLLDAGHRGTGLEFLIEDVVSPDVLGGRARLAPIAWFTESRAARILELGFTAAADLSVPRNLPVAGGTTVEERAIPVIGGDLAVRAVDGERVLLQPYLAVNGMDGEAGLHAGLGASLRLAPGREIWLHARGEYRYLGSDYHPVLFNPFHEHDRLAFSRDPETGDPRSLADHLAEAEDPVSHGGMANLALDWEQTVRVEVRYDGEGANRPHWILARVDVRPSEALTIGGLYAGRDPRGGVEVFSRDSLIGLAVSGRIAGPLQVYTEFSRRYRRDGAEVPLANESALGLGLLFLY
jgi:hypothetical protein